MAKGKYKAKAESQLHKELVESLEKQIAELTTENAKLKEQATQDHMHHAFQIAQMHEQMTGVTSPRIEQLEQEVLTLKKALRGL